MKKGTRLLCIALLAVICLSVFTACAKDKNGPFIGEFRSTFVEGRNTKEISFELVIRADKTFTLKRFSSEKEQWESIGTWAGNTSKDDYGIICLITESGQSGDYTFTEYFTLSLLDDGRVVAVAGVSLNSSFGISAGSVVVFEK